MMDGERKSYTERILSAIEYGRLPNDETERRLSALIEAEVNKTDSAADMELIDACQSLLWQLHTHGEVPYESHYDQNWVQITKRLNRDVVVVKAAKSVGRILAATAAVVFVVLGLSGNLRWSWLEHDDTSDQQQHIIAGNEIGVELIQSAIAEHGESGQIRVSSPEEIANYISFVPIPQTINEVWEFSFADISINPMCICIDVQYANTLLRSKVTYSTVLFTDVDAAYYTLEQSVAGNSVAIEGHQVYVAANMHRTMLYWTDGLAYVQISGECQEQEGKQIVQILLKEWYR